MTKIRFMRRGRLVEIEKSGGRFRPADEMARLLLKVSRSPDGCWLWMDALDKDGYGKFQAAGGTTERAHRASWRLHGGQAADGLLCLHRCDNRACVNPEHLFLGTQRDNIQDMISKGRRGNPNAGIDAGVAAQIKAALLSGRRGVDVAADFGVSRATVYQIKSGKTWKCVEANP
jgi:hypothetical protein